MALALPSRNWTSLTYLAMGGAALLVAHQVAAKAARDGLFLDRFEPADLPKMVSAAAIFSVAAALWFARLLTRRGPVNNLLPALLGSAALHVAEFGLISWRSGPVVVIVYLHVACLGAILLATFWSVASEAFDPREAKIGFPRIAAAGTAGGIAGGLLAERSVAYFSVESLLLLLAAFHLVAAGVVWMLRRQIREPAVASRAPADYWSSARQAIGKAPFLKNLGLLVILGTVVAALLDFLFKSGAVQSIGKGPALGQFFARFYTANQILTLLAQTFLTPLALRSLGLGKTVMTLPLAVFAGAGGALLVPGFVSSAPVRALELFLRGSLFRSAYELFFTPIPAGEKRAVKTVIDVGCDRMGDALGAGAIQVLLLFTIPDQIFAPLLLLAMIFAAICVWIAARMDSAYLKVLEHGLVSRAIELDQGTIQDSTTLSAVLRTVPQQSVAKHPAPPLREAREPAHLPPADPALDRVNELRSGDASRVRAALSPGTPFDPLAVPQIIRLLAWNEVSAAARDYLSRHADRVAGQLTDGLLDTDFDFAVRRRIPRILARCATQRTVDGLLPALDDPQFEIRFQAGRALEYLHRSHEDLVFNHSGLWRIIERELSVSRPIWEGRRLLDHRDDADATYAYLDEVLRDRTNKSLEHVFSLLAILLPREPLKIAFRALHSDDRLLRGLAFEYLQTSLPPAVAAQFTLILDSAAAPQSGRDSLVILEELMASHQSIMAKLRISSAGAPEPGETLPKATQS